MSNPLENLSGQGKPLQAEPPDAKEIAGLVKSGLARLKDAQNATLAIESRFDLAYNAAHSLCSDQGKGLSFWQPLHCLSSVAAHIRSGRRGLARFRQMPQHPQLGRI